MASRNYLPTAALLTAIVILSWVIFDVAQRFVPGMSAGRDAGNTKVETVADTPAGDYDVKQIVAAHLFGVAAKPKPVVQQAPETRLRLTLLGVMASNRDLNGRAVIASDAAPDRSYAIGDRIDGTDAKLHSIEKDRVIIERGKRLEKLSLERPDLESPKTPDVPAQARARSPRAPAIAARRRQQARSDVRRRRSPQENEATRAQRPERGNRPEMPRIPF